MKLMDLGFTVFLVVALLGTIYAAKTRYPDEYKSGIKVLTDAEKKYIDPYRTPDDEFYGGNGDN